jgi:predicted membrane channel-forming protein YqfA (hemolysin III family)
MATKKSKTSMYFFILLIVAGCVLACSSIITNDYLKLLVVMASLCVGLFGIMKSVGGKPESEEEE